MAFIILVALIVTGTVLWLVILGLKEMGFKPMSMAMIGWKRFKKWWSTHVI